MKYMYVFKWHMRTMQYICVYVAYCNVIHVCVYVAYCNTIHVCMYVCKDEDDGPYETEPERKMEMDKE